MRDSENVLRASRWVVKGSSPFARFGWRPTAERTMSFHMFDLTELPEEADDAFAIEFKTKHAKMGITLSEDEARGVAHALQDGLDGDLESWDGKHASEI